MTIVDMLTDGDSLSLEEALGAIQPMSADNSDLASTSPMVSAHISLAVA